MATLTHADSKRRYSWWWDSHISPKNSKWLHENLTDMDTKVKAMLKLIEEDADSFRKRAEMYYRKRPELIKLVEEFYRAYRALAERYDHATGALRQAHHTMAEAFPDQVPLMLPDESPSGSSTHEPEPYTPEMLQGTKLDFDSDDSSKRKGKNFGRSPKGGLNDHVEQTHVIKSHVMQEHQNNETSDRCDELKSLQEEVSRLLEENQNLKKQITSESVRADGAAMEVQRLQDTLSRLGSEKEKALLEYQQFLERVLSREAEISHAQEELKNQNDAMMKSLEGELRLLKEESASKIKNLQTEVVLHEGETKFLQEKISFLQYHKHNLEERHLGLTKQIEAVNSNVASLHEMVKELQDGNVELKKLCKKNEDEKNLHLENMEKISVRNAVLEISFADANSEIDRLRERVKLLEQSFESLHGKISARIAEKAELLSQVESISKNMDQLIDKNNFLENSLFDVNTELVRLNGKLKGLEESHESLSDKKSELLTEKNALVIQVQDVTRSLGNMERMYAELQNKHLQLEKEKDSSVHQVQELQDLLKQEKLENESLAQSNHSRFATLESQIVVLQEDVRVKEENIKLEEEKSISAQIESFILQSHLSDIKDTNFILSKECQKLLEKSKSAEQRISKLEEEHLLLEEKIDIMLKQNEKMTEGVHLILAALNISLDGQFPDSSADESLLHLILCEIRHLVSTISHAHDENECLILEKAVLSTFLKQFGLDMASLELEKEVLEKDSKSKAEELELVQRNCEEFLAANGQLKQDLFSSNERLEELAAEKDALALRLSDLEEVHDSLLGTNHSLSKELLDTRETKNMLEQSNTLILEEVVNLENLYVIFKNYNAEKVLQLEALMTDLSSLHNAKSSLNHQIRQMNERLGSLEVENISLKESIASLEVNLSEARNSCNQLHLEVDSGRRLLMLKDGDMLITRKSLEAAESRNKELSKKLEEHKIREEHYNLQLNKGIVEMQKCEQEFAALFYDHQLSEVNAIVFKEQFVELLMIYEIHAMVQRQVLLGDIASSKCYIDELKSMLNAVETENRQLKADLNGYLPLVTSLYKSIAALEDITLSMAQPYTAANLEDQNDKKSEERSKSHSATHLTGVFKLQKLHDKVEALQKMLLDTKVFLYKERIESNATLAAANKEIALLRSKGGSGKEKSVIHSIPRKDDSENYDVKAGEIMKDIPLDHISRSPFGSSISSYGPSVIPGTGDDELVFDLWDVEKGHDNPLVRVKSERSIHPSSGVLEKELSIDKLDTPKFKERQREWNRKVLERLASDAKRLSLLQSNTEELKRNMEDSYISSNASSSEFEMAKAQLKEAESTISHLMNFNDSLRRKAERYRSSTDNSLEKGKDILAGNRSRRHISERARRASEKTARLELELQKIHYILLKLEEEQKYKKAKALERRRRVMLKDYLYGWKENQRERRSRFCACARPSTVD